MRTAIALAIRILPLLTPLACASPLGAVDSPDAPDHIGEFRSRAAANEQAVAGAADGSAFTGIDALLARLESALERAQDALSASRSADEQAQLKRAQSRWRAHFVADTKLIRTIWSRERAGSSAELTAGMDRAVALQQRVECVLRMRAAVSNSEPWGPTSELQA